MKYVLFLLSFYVFALAIMPCTDTVCKQESHQSTHSDDDDIDTCSPLCSCACCGVAGYLQTILYSPILVFEIKSSVFKNIFTNQFTSSNFHISIWQPPKLS